MTRDEAKEYIKSKATQYLKPAKKAGYICPICGSGGGPKGTGITSKDNIHFTCWGKGTCFSNADIIDIIGLEYGLNDKEKFDKAYELFGVTIDGTPEKPKPLPAKQAPETEESKALDPDLNAFFLEAKNHIKETDYPQRRGLSEEVIERFNLGFVRNWENTGTPRLVIPTSPTSCLARDTRPNGAEGDRHRKKGTPHIFNAEALYTSEKPIFIVEGEIDALSIIEAGGEAVATGSTKYISKLHKLLLKQRTEQTLLLALDNDEPGKEATEQLIKQLEEIKPPINYYKTEVKALYLGHKDANEALLADRQAFISAVAKVERTEETKKAEELERYKQNSVSYNLPIFRENIIERRMKEAIPTGFKELDEKLDGGLYEGFYVIGAISSLGKTTYVMQMADHIAKAGKDVLIFSLEMSREDLMAKSISRHTFEINRKEDNSYKNAKTARAIYKYNDLREAEQTLIENAMIDYNEYAERIFVIEGAGQASVDVIRKTVEKHVSLTQNEPVVIVDYLQIISPSDGKATDKQNTDRAITELKRISRDFKIPLIAISSFNRSSYQEEAKMEAFKESGNIEYSADVLIGLHLKGIQASIGRGQKDQNKPNDTKLKRNPIREVEALILKNRFGAVGDILEYRYYTLFNYFEENTDTRR